MRIPLTVFLGLVFLFHANADGVSTEYLTRHWGVEEGTAHNTVNSLVQSDDGFLWMATDAGVVRFDGLAFRRLNTAIFPDAKSSTIRSIIDGGDGTLLMLNANSELFRLKGMSASPVRLAARPTSSSMQLLFRERDGVFWVGFLDGSVWRCADGRVAAFPAPERSAPGSASFGFGSDGVVYLSRGGGLERYIDGALRGVGGTDGRTFAVGSSKSGGVWVAEKGRVYRMFGTRLEAQGGTVWPADLKPDVLEEGADGSLWLGFANYGLVHWRGGQAGVVTAFGSRIKAILDDGEGDIWVGTEGNGLNRLRPRRFDLLANAADTPDEAASSVGEDTLGMVWAAAHSSLKINRGDHWTSLTVQDGWPKSPSWICPDGHGNVWIASGRTLYRATAGAATPPVKIALTTGSNIRSLYGLREGGVWVACDSGPLFLIQNGAIETFGESQGYTGAKAAVACEDDGGTVWIGTGRGELFFRKSGRFASMDLSGLLRGNGIRAIVTDPDGWRWIGTDGVGLLVQNSTRNILVGRDQGLPDDVISQILEDDFGFLWFGSRRGLFKVRRQDLIDCATGKRATVTPIVYGLDDGLSDISAVGGHQPAAWKTHTGKLWFTTRAGFVSTQPGPEGANAGRPRVYVDEAVADGNPIPSSGTSSSTARRYFFRFTAPFFSAPEIVRFRYRLDGFDPDWSEATVQRTAVYPQLPPGRYQFQVESSTSDDQWDAESAAKIDLTVVPVWWETVWARLIAASLVMIGSAMLVRYVSQRRLKRRLAALEARERIGTERERIARNLHDGLGAGLTHVGMMAEQLAEDCDNVEEMKQRALILVGRVQGVARDLDAAVWAVSPRHDRLPALCSYLGEYALEFFRETPLRCRVEIGDDLPDVAISPEVRHHLFLAAKEALNNALKHSGASQLTLAMTWEPNAATIEIADDGHGFDVAAAGASKRNGLRNLRERINEAGGKLAIASTSAGTTLRIHLPCPLR